MDVERIWDRQQQRLLASAEQAWNDTYNPSKWFAAIDARDLNDQLFDCRDELLALVKAGKAEAIGKLVIAVAQDYAEALARRECGDDVTSDAAAVANRLLAADVAALNAAIERDEQRFNRAAVRDMKEALL